MLLNIFAVGINSRLKASNDLAFTSLFHRHLKTDSDSEVLLNIFADEIHRAHQKFVQTHPGKDPNQHKTEFVLEAGSNTMKLLSGAYSCITLVKGVGLVAFRDPHGIRPLVLGKRRNLDGTVDYAVASEDCAFGPIAFERVSYGVAGGGGGAKIVGA